MPRAPENSPVVDDLIELSDSVAEQNARITLLENLPAEVKRQGETLNEILKLLKNGQPTPCPFVEGDKPEDPINSGGGGILDVDNLFSGQGKTFVSTFFEFPSFQRGITL